MEKRMIKKLISVALVGSMVFSLAGCGKKEDVTTWEKIQEEGKFTYACSGGYPPFNYKDDDGNLVGFDVEIANALAEKMGVEAEGITTEWDGIIGGLTGKRFDCILGSMAVTEERLKQISFTDPYYYDGAQFFAKADKNLESIADETVTKVGVVTGTTYETEVAKYENVTDIVCFSSDQENFIACDDGRIDGFATSRFVGLDAPEEYNIVPVGELLYTENIAIGVRQEDTEFLNELNKALAAIVEDGTYAEISEKYFGCNILEK